MPSSDEQYEVTRLLAPIRRPCVVELGAHTGEDESWIRAALPEPCHYIMVEPDPRNCQAILDREVSLGLSTVPGRELLRFGNFSTFRYSPWLGSRKLIMGAVADACEFRQFHFSENIETKSRTSGSLRAPSGHLKHFPEIRFDYSGMVQCYTLDAIFDREWLTKIDLLWVDIQGAENMMIAGGRTALSHSRYLFMEVEKEELYAGEALGYELIAMLPDWDIVKVFPYNILMENRQFVEREPR